MEGCQCHACLHHTKQYIHHLLVSHELLGEVLLYAHNQHQLLQLFEEARKHKEAGTFGNWIDQHCQATIL